MYAPGDLYIKVKVKPHTYFKRENFDIHTTNYINISLAVIGGNVKVKTLYGDVTVHVDAGTNEGDTKKIMNYVFFLLFRVFLNYHLINIKKEIIM